MDVWRAVEFGVMITKAGRKPQVIDTICLVLDSLFFDKWSRNQSKRSHFVTKHALNAGYFPFGPMQA